jgi:hypothetical protein
MDNYPQREMPFLADVSAKPPKKVPIELVKACRSELDALNLCMNLSNLADETIREHLGIDKGHFSRMRKGRGNFPPNKRIALMVLCENLAPVQYEAYRLGCLLQEQDKDALIEQLYAQLTERRAA